MSYADEIQPADSEDIAQLQAALRRTRRGFTVVALLFAMVMFNRTQPVPPPVPDRIDLGLGLGYFDYRGMSVRGNYINDNGFFSARLGASSKEVIAGLQAAEEGARLELSGARELVFKTSEITPIVEADITGKVSARLLVDTDTGEWRLVRFRKDEHGKPIDTEERQLVAPLHDPANDPP